MENKNIKNKIEKIAIELVNDKETLSRADLAYELKKYGIKQDSYLISELVWNTFLQSKHKETLRKAFTNNNGNRSLIDEYQITATLEQGNFKEAISLVQKKAYETGITLEKIKSDLNAALSTVISNNSIALSQSLTGSSGVQKVRREADSVFQRYSNLVNGYEKARCNIQEVTSSFIEIRADIEKIFQQYTIALVDIFGDSIKVIQPALFDFNKIEWLDVQGMLKQIELQYTTLTTRCTELLEEISDNFHQSIQSSIDSYRALNNKQIGLIIAGLNMFSHYMSASTKTNEVKAGLLTMKNDLRRDATNIKGDILRLSKIYKQINDIFIPQANTFYRYADKILSQELEGLLNAIYDNKEALALKKQRDGLLERYKELEHYLNDERTNIVYYNDHIQECNTLLRSLKSQYEEAILLKPQKPSFITNIFSLGNARKSYNRDLYSWSINCSPLVKRYESLNVDIKLDQDDKNAQEELFKEHNREYSEIKLQLSKINQKMKQAIKVNDTTKKQVVKHLKDIVTLLNVAKSITENRLSEQDTKAISIKEFGNLSIPSDISKNIDAFCQLINDNQSVNYESIKNIIHNDKCRLPLDIETEKKTNPNDDYSTNEPIIEEIDSLVKDAFSKTMETFNRWAKLQALQAQNNKSKLHYHNEMEYLKNKFQKELAEIDNKSEALRKIIAQCNTSQDTSTLKQGLMYLADINEEQWQENDWDSFLEGKKSLTI